MYNGMGFVQKSRLRLIPPTGCPQREILQVPAQMAWECESQSGFRTSVTYGQVPNQVVVRAVLLFLSISSPATEATGEVVDIANLVAMASPVREPVPQQFVQVSEEGTHFVLNGRPFFFAGANCYYLMTRATEYHLRHQVTDVLDTMVDAGLTVLRTWAFNDGNEWNALQPEPGVFDQRVFCGLDFVLNEARKRGIRVILALVNYWGAYGGMAQYVRWSYIRRGLQVPEEVQPEMFYTDPWCQDIYHNFLVNVTARTNSLTGVVYSDDPTIMAWELANEPRCEGDFSGSQLQNWISDTAEFLKSLDPNHMVGTGSEGFLGSSTPDYLADNPYDVLSLGCDFLRNHMPDGIDFASAHLWPDTWLPKADDEHMLQFARRWINAHVDVVRDQLGKPLILGEFGKRPSGLRRAAFYDKVFSRVSHHAKAGHGMGGAILWSAADLHYPDYDGFTVYLRPPFNPAPTAPVTPTSRDPPPRPASRETPLSGDPPPRPAASSRPTPQGGATPLSHTSAPASPFPAHTPRTPQSLFTADGDEPLLLGRVARHPDADHPPDVRSQRHGGAFAASEGEEVCVGPDADRPPDVLSQRHGAAFDVSEGEEVCVGPDTKTPAQGVRAGDPGTGPLAAGVGSVPSNVGSAPGGVGSVRSDVPSAPGGVGDVHEEHEQKTAEVVDGREDAENVHEGRREKTAEVAEGRKDADSVGGERGEEEPGREPDQATCRLSGEFAGMGVTRDARGDGEIAEGGFGGGDGGGGGSGEGVCPAGSHGGEGSEKPPSSRRGTPHTDADAEGDRVDHSSWDGAGDAEGDGADHSGWDDGTGVDMAGGEGGSGPDQDTRWGVPQNRANSRGEEAIFGGAGPDQDVGWGVPQRHASHGGEEEIFGETTTDLNGLHGEKGTPQRRESDAATVGLIRQFAEEMAALNKHAGKDCSIM